MLLWSRILHTRIPSSLRPIRHFHTTCLRLGAPAAKPPTDLENRIAAIPIERFRNFCIVAHVDHGKKYS
jgi:hypothetical protein